jgi:hypothetical protein
MFECERRASALRMARARRLTWSESEFFLFGDGSTKDKDQACRSWRALQAPSKRDQLVRFFMAYTRKDQMTSVSEVFQPTSIVD